MRPGSLAASIDFFRGTNYPDVRDLTHKLWTVGEFSGSNHTSVLLAPNNPQCLTAPPLPFPTPTMYWSLPSAGSWRSARLPGPFEKNQQTLARKTSARLMISSWNHHHLLSFWRLSPLVKGMEGENRLSWKADDSPPGKSLKLQVCESQTTGFKEQKASGFQSRFCYDCVLCVLVRSVVTNAREDQGAKIELSMAPSILAWKEQSTLLNSFVGVKPISICCAMVLVASGSAGCRQEFIAY